MKYIRTKDEIKKVELISNGKDLWFDDDYQSHGYNDEPIAETIEELCDCYSYDIETTRDFAVARSWKLHNLEREIYGCVKTDKGLIYVAKMNDKGELELL